MQEVYQQITGPAARPLPGDNAKTSDITQAFDDVIESMDRVLALAERATPGAPVRRATRPRPAARSLTLRP